MKRGSHRGMPATTRSDWFRPVKLYEVCDEDAVDVEDEPEPDGSADAAHGAAAKPDPHLSLAAARRLARRTAGRCQRPR